MHITSSTGKLATSEEARVTLMRGYCTVPDPDNWPALRAPGEDPVGVDTRRGDNGGSLLVLFLPGELASATRAAS